MSVKFRGTYNRIRKKLKRLYGCIRKMEGNIYPIVLAYYREVRRIREANKLPRSVAPNGVEATPEPYACEPMCVEWHEQGNYSPQHTVFKCLVLIWTISYVLVYMVY